MLADHVGLAEAIAVNFTDVVRTYRLGGCRWRIAVNAMTPGTNVRLHIERVE